MSEFKKIVCLDFDGVIHSYTSGWQGACAIVDEPVEGAIEYIGALMDVGGFEVGIYSSRSMERGAIQAMKGWLIKWGLSDWHLANLKFYTEKPPAHITIDDRAIQFRGDFPPIEYIERFKPWNKQ